MKALFFTFDGRIGRRTYWIGATLLIVALIVAVLPIAIVEAIIVSEGPMSRWGTIAIFIVTLLAMVPAYSLTIRRINDLDHPAWTAWALVGMSVVDAARSSAGVAYGTNPLTMAFGLLFALAFLWAVVVLGLRRGTIGPNRHGPDPVAGDGSAAA
jgi:uncharacterized membrane protein YhaH (DUF805 family)